MSLLKVFCRLSLANHSILLSETSFLKLNQSRAWFSFAAEVVTSTSGKNLTRRHTFCTMPEKKEFKRLPTNVKPENYKLRLQPDLEKFTFKGQEIIDVKVGRKIADSPGLILINRQTLFKYIFWYSYCKFVFFKTFLYQHKYFFLFAIHTCCMLIDTQ